MLRRTPLRRHTRQLPSQIRIHIYQPKTSRPDLFFGDRRNMSSRLISAMTISCAIRRAYRMRGS